jgi:uncharacterized membrane protein
MGGLLLVGLVALALALWLIFVAFNGALVMLSFASAQGFVGLVAFVAAWVFLFPVMLLIAIVIGFFMHRAISLEDRRERDVARWRHKHLGEPLPITRTLANSPPDDLEERYKWANRLPPYD